MRDAIEQERWTLVWRGQLHLLGSEERRLLCAALGIEPQDYSDLRPSRHPLLGGKGSGAAAAHSSTVGSLGAHSGDR